MNKRQTFNDLLMKITSCNTQHELKEIIKDINHFIEDYSIYGDSNEYKKLNNSVGIMKMKLKRDFKIEESIISTITEDVDISGYSDEDFLEVFVMEFRAWIKKNHGDEIGEYPRSLLVKKYSKEFGTEYEVSDYDMRYNNTLTQMANIGRVLVKKEVRKLPSLKRDIIFTKRFKKVLDHFISKYDIPDFVKIHFKEDTPFMVRGWMTAEFEPAMKYDESLDELKQFSRELKHFITNYLGFEIGSPVHGNIDFYFQDGFTLLGVDEWVKNVLNKKIKKDIKTWKNKSVLHSIKFNTNTSKLYGEIGLVYSASSWNSYREIFRDELKQYLKNLGYSSKRLIVFSV